MWRRLLRRELFLQRCWRHLYVQELSYQDACWFAFSISGEMSSTRTLRLLWKAAPCVSLSHKQFLSQHMRACVCMVHCCGHGVCLHVCDDCAYWTVVHDCRPWLLDQGGVSKLRVRTSSHSQSTRDVTMSLAAVVNVVGIGVYRAIRTPESAMLPLFCLTAHALRPFVCAISRMVITFTGTKKEEKGLRKKKVLTKVKVAVRKLKQQSKGKRNLEIVTYYYGSFN